VHVSEAPYTYYNRTVYLGTTVKFRCPTKLKEAVIWGRWTVTVSSFLRWLYIGLRPGEMENGVDRRLTIEQNNSYVLVISNVTAEDSAAYGCVEHIGFGNRHFFILTVAGELQ